METVRESEIGMKAKLLLFPSSAWERTAFKSIVAKLRFACEWLMRRTWSAKRSFAVVPCPSGAWARGTAARTGLAIAVLLTAGAVRGADSEPPGITVTGTGEVKTKPNRLEIELAASGSAELTGDALVKYRDSLKRTIEAFEQLGIKNLRVEQRGLSIQSQDANNNNMNRFNGMPNMPTKMQIDISGDLRLVLPDADKMSEEELTDTISKLLDTAKDSGAGIGGSSTSQMMARIYGQQMSTSVVTFVVDNIDEVRQQAYQEAFKQAEARAKRLADLAGAKLGPVISLQESLEVQPSNESSRQQRLMAAIYGWGDLGEKGDGRVTSEKLGEIPVRVMLRVRFSIAEKEKK